MGRTEPHFSLISNPVHPKQSKGVKRKGRREKRRTSSSPQLLDTKRDLLVRARGHIDRGRVIGLRELDPGDGDGGGAGVPENGFAGGEAAD